jgi:hypothetical protein
VFAKPGTVWNGMKFTFQENKKPGMERNGMEWKGKEWNRKKWNGMDNKFKFTILVLYAQIQITLSTLHVLLKW